MRLPLQVRRASPRSPFHTDGEPVPPL